MPGDEAANAARFTVDVAVRNRNAAELHQIECVTPRVLVPVHGRDPFPAYERREATSFQISLMLDGDDGIDRVFVCCVAKSAPR